MDIYEQSVFYIYASESQGNVKIPLRLKSDTLFVLDMIFDVD